MLLSKLNYSATRNTALQHVLELLLIRTSRFTYIMLLIGGKSVNDDEGAKGSF